MKRAIFLSFLLTIVLGILPISTSAQKTEVEPATKVLYEANTGIVSAPTVVGVINNKTELDSLSNSDAPAQIAYFITDDGTSVAFADGSSELLEVVIEACGNTVIPMFQVSSMDCAQAITDYIAENSLYDLFIASSDKDILLFVSSLENYGTRLAYIVGNEDISSIPQNVYGSNSTLAIISTELSREETEYLQKRFVSVWYFNPDLDDTDDTDCQSVNSALANGSDGVFVSNPANAYSIYESVTDPNALCRRPFNIAHRGLHKTVFENTVAAMIEAFEAGADAVECDVFSTNDGNIVITHDEEVNDINLIENTREYVKNNISIGKDSNGNKVSIAYLDEMLDVLALEEYKDKILVIEIKGETNLKQLLEMIEDKGVMNQCVFISFSGKYLNELHELCDLPLADLHSFKSLSKAYQTLGKNHAVANSSVFNISPLTLQRRGIQCLYWTAETVKDINEKAALGCNAITTNVCDEFNVIINY